MEKFIQELKLEIKKLDKYHDRIVDIDEVFNVIDNIANKYISKIEKSTSQNTEITYIYREPETNNKTWFSYIIKGECTNEQGKELINSMADNHFWIFYPELVGLPDNKITHEYFEWIGMVSTEKPPTLDITIEELVNAFKKAKEQEWNWNYPEEKERD